MHDEHRDFVDESVPSAFAKANEPAPLVTSVPEKHVIHLGKRPDLYAREMRLLENPFIEHIPQHPNQPPHSED